MSSLSVKGLIRNPVLVPSRTLQNLQSTQISTRESLVIITDPLVGKPDCTRMFIPQIVDGVIVHSRVQALGGGIAKTPEQELLHMKDFLLWRVRRHSL